MSNPGMSCLCPPRPRVGTAGTARSGMHTAKPWEVGAEAGPACQRRGEGGSGGSGAPPPGPPAGLTFPVCLAPSRPQPPSPGLLDRPVQAPRCLLPPPLLSLSLPRSPLSPPPPLSPVLTAHQPLLLLITIGRVTPELSSTGGGALCVPGCARSRCIGEGEVGAGGTCARCTEGGGLGAGTSLNWGCAASPTSCRMSPSLVERKAPLCRIRASATRRSTWLRGGGQPCGWPGPGPGLLHGAPATPRAATPGPLTCGRSRRPPPRGPAAPDP